MKIYCENCRRIIETDACIHCGNQRLRVPKAEDLCFLTEQGYAQSAVLSEILKQNGIPFRTDERALRGFPSRTGNRVFRVPFDRFADAAFILDEVFYAPPEEAGAPCPAEPDVLPGGVFGPEEIDGMELSMLDSLNREELTAFRKKLADTLKLMKSQESRRKERFNILRDMMEEADCLIDDLA